MKKEQLVEALERICEESNGCDNCPIAKADFCVSYCQSHQFKDMTEGNLILYADIAGVNIPDEPTVEEDPVNHPNHYTSGGIECIDAIAASMTPIEYAGFLKGQVLKYVWRYRLKGNPVQDLKKACFYMDRLIQCVENGEAVK